MRPFRTDAANALRLFKAGTLAREGRGLAFWFNPARVSVAEIPMADRALFFLVKTQTADFQDLAVQGMLFWAVADVGRLADRVDVSIDLGTGAHIAQPEDHIAKVLTGMVRLSAGAALRGQGVKQALEAGLASLQAQLAEALGQDPTLEALVLKVVAVRVAGLAPSSERAPCRPRPSRRGWRARSSWR